MTEEPEAIGLDRAVHLLRAMEPVPGVVGCTQAAVRVLQELDALRAEAATRVVREDLRDRFATKAMQGLVTLWPIGTEHLDTEHLDTEVATRAYQIADAMLRARETRP